MEARPIVPRPGTRTTRDRKPPRLHPCIGLLWHLSRRRCREAKTQRHHRPKQIGPSKIDRGMEERPNVPRPGKRTTRDRKPPRLHHAVAERTARYMKTV